MIEKVIKRKGDKLYLKWKGYDNLFNSWINKKDLVISYVFKNMISSYVFKTIVSLQRIKMSQYFPNTYEPFGGDINFKVDLSNYEKKADIKNI